MEKNVHLPYQASNGPAAVSTESLHILGCNIFVINKAYQRVASLDFI